jgi:predicted nucleic acid-binding protein
VIVADTGAILALLDRGDRHHEALHALYLDDPDAWILPWAILPEVDYLTATTLGDRAERAWLDDLANGGFTIEWGADRDLTAAQQLVERYESLQMGLVDAVVMIVAERLSADIATLDLRHFGVVRLKHSPRLFPRDAGPSARRAPRRKLRAVNQREN